MADFGPCHFCRDPVTFPKASGGVPDRMPPSYVGVPGCEERGHGDVHGACSAHRECAEQNETPSTPVQDGAGDASDDPLPAHDPQAVYEALRNEVTQLHGYWKLYGQLFTDETRNAILKDAADSAFGILQDALARCIEISIGRLLDSEGNQAQENLTLRRLPALLRARHHGEMAIDAESRIVALRKHAADIIKRRHKRTAHSDLGVALGKVSTDRVTWESVDEAVKHIRKLMVYVEEEMRGESVATAYDHIILNGDGDDLIHALEMADAHIDCERAKRRMPPRRRKPTTS